MNTSKQGQLSGWKSQIGFFVICAGLMFALITAAAPAAEPGVTSLDYRPAIAIPGEYDENFGDHGDPQSGVEFVEPLADHCYLPQTTGGTIELLVSNPTRKPMRIEGVTVDGSDASGLAARPFGDPSSCDEGDLRWWRAEPELIPAGASSVVALNGTRFAPGRTIRFGVRTDTGLLRLKTRLAAPKVRVAAVRFSGDLKRVRIYLEPNARLRGTLVPHRVRIGKRTVSARYRGSLYKGGVLLVTARVPRLTAGKKIVVSVPLRRRGRHRPVVATASASTRAYPSRFPIGMGVGFGGTTLPTGADAAVLRDAGIDTLVAFDQNFSFDDLLASAHAGGFSTVIGSKMPGPDETHTDTAEALLREMPRLAKDSTVTGFYPYDEPDIPFPEPIWRYRSSEYMVGLLERAHAADPTHPNFVNLWSPNAAAEYGAIPDVGGWDHYPLGRASLALESAAEFARTSRSQTSPNPFWFWSQAVSFEQERVPSTEEMRVYNTLAVAGGAGGLLWFTYDGSTTTRPEWQEMAAESRVLSALRYQLAAGSSYPARSGLPGVDVSSVGGPGLSFLAVSNLNYRLGGTSPTQFTEQTGVDVDWKVPPWLARRPDLTFAEVTPGSGLRRLGPKRGLSRDRSRPARVRLTVDQLDSARWFIAAPRRQVDQLRARLNP